MGIKLGGAGGETVFHKDMIILSKRRCGFINFFFFKFRRMTFLEIFCLILSLNVNFFLHSELQNKKIQTEEERLTRGEHDSSKRGRDMDLVYGNWKLHKKFLARLKCILIFKTGLRKSFFPGYRRRTLRTMF